MFFKKIIKILEKRKNNLCRLLFLSMATLFWELTLCKWFICTVQFSHYNIPSKWLFYSSLLFKYQKCLLILKYLCVCAKSLQSCPTLCNPLECSLPGSFVHGDSPGKPMEWLLCPPAGDLSTPGIEPLSLTSALAGGFFTTRATWKAPT